MPYFTEFPYVPYQFPDNVVRQYKNISIRPALIEEIFGVSSNFETYTVRDGDTPETIAFDLYGDVNFHWTIMLANNFLNLYTDWPRTSAQLEEYLISKYQDSENEPRISTYERIQFTGTAAENFTNDRGWQPHHLVDEETDLEYSVDSIGATTDAFGRAITVPVLAPVSIYQYEEELNNAKREIVVPKFAVVQQMKDELRRLIDG